MMNNLFSSFDPSSSTLSMNWIMMTTPIILMTPKSKKTSKAYTTVSNVSSTLLKEMSGIIQKMKVKETPKITCALFITLALMNSWSLIPSSFTPTAQISTNLPLALMMWVPSIAFSTIKKTKNTLCHLVPSGTPAPLMPLMVLIELTSNMIRPLTLAIRLTANMVAGHILIALTEEFILSGNSPIISSIMSISILTILETGVAFIQAFIFSILVTLFSSENH